MSATGAIHEVGADPSQVTSASWKDYAIRFIFGGAITALVGVLGKAFGPVVAGLFLAFPAILPASVTLVAEREGEEKAGVDAFGAAIGSVGLMAFGAIVWWLAARSAAWQVLLLASICWLVVSGVVWLLVGQSKGEEQGG